jgi:hypothetical protein
MEKGGCEVVPESILQCDGFGPKRLRVLEKITNAENGAKLCEIDVESTVGMKMWMIPFVI